MIDFPNGRYIEEFGNAIAQYLKKHRDRLAAYEWPIEQTCVEECHKRGLIPDLTVNGGRDGTNSLRKAVAERAASIHRELGGEQRLTLLVDLANFVVSDWGGVKGNKPETLRKYVERFNGITVPFEQIRSADELRAQIFGKKAANGLFGFTGIASWSKWLNFVWNDWALIYDARIAFALNAIHFLYSVDAPVFPVPAGRNSLLAALDAESSAAFRYLGGRGTVVKPAADIGALLHSVAIRDEDAYCYYLAVMEVAHRGTWDSEGDHHLVDTEMLLFMLSINVIAEDFSREMLSRLTPLEEERGDYGLIRAA